jgi:hypothetical protein
VGWSRQRVVEEVGAAESTISEVLAGKRRLNRAQVGKLARYFHVEPGRSRSGNEETEGCGKRMRTRVATTASPIEPRPLFLPTTHGSTARPRRRVNPGPEIPKGFRSAGWQTFRMGYRVWGKLHLPLVGEPTFRPGTQRRTLPLSNGTGYVDETGVHGMFDRRDPRVGWLGA